METRICPQCGKQIPADAITCKFCGTLFFASPNELEGERSLRSAYNRSFGEGNGEYYNSDPVEYDENGGYYDEDGNYYDASGGHFDAEGNYYDTEGGYYDKDGNYYDKDGNFFPGYYDEDGNYHEGVRTAAEKPVDFSFATSETRSDNGGFKPSLEESFKEDLSEDFVYTEDGDVDNSAPDIGPGTEMKFRKTLVIALTVIVLLLVFLVVVVINSKSNLSGFNKKYNVSRAYTNYVPATIPGESDLDSDHVSDSDETVSDTEDSLPEAVIPDSVPQPDSSSVEETTATTSMPEQVIPETTTPSTTTPTQTEPPDTTPSETQPTDTEPTESVPAEDDSSDGGGLVFPDDSSSEPDDSMDSSEAPAEGEE
ncbi:MAG: zinc ribbon domain-containing protein [Ruminococcus sp.]|nr:zinc ribbon domain-containing protein [Ruminococcus sp.]